MISVVIPLYNKARCIGSTIQCVLHQTYTDFELIIVNDGSTDDGVAVVSAVNDNRIRLINKTNGGVSSARNEGIRQSNGAYIAFLDADDYWEPTYLEELQRLIDTCPDAGIFGIALGLISQGKKNYDSGEFPSDFCGYVEHPWQLRSGCWTGSSTTIKRDAFDKVGMFDVRMAYGEDLDMWWRVVLEYRGAFLNKPLAYYEQDAENRAMNKAMPFEKHLPFYIEKYVDYRAADKEFRFFFDRECLYRLFQYTGMKKYRKDLRRVLRQIDFSLQKRSMRFRFIFPRLYRVYLKKKGRL